METTRTPGARLMSDKALFSGTLGAISGRNRKEQGQKRAEAEMDRSRNGQRQKRAGAETDRDNNEQRQKRTETDANRDKKHRSRLVKLEVGCHNSERRPVSLLSI